MSFTVNNFVSGLIAGANSGSISISIPAGHTVGVVVIERNFNGQVAGTLSDSAGNTYTIPAGGVSTFSGAYVSLSGYSLAAASPLTSVTYTTGTAGTNAFIIYAWDITATGPISFADAKAANFTPASTTANAVTTASLAITSADGLIVAAARNWGAGSDCSAGTGFITDSSVEAAAEHKAITASTAATFTSVTANDTGVAGLAFQVAAAGAAPFKQPDLDERVTTKVIASDFSPPNLLANQVLKLPPFIQKELPGWAIRARGIYTDFAAPNLIFRLPVATTPLAPADLSQQVKYRFVGSDFSPPNLLAQQTLKLPPVTQSELPGWVIRANGVYTDFSPPNLLTQGTLKLPPFPVRELGGALSIRGVFTDFTPPNLPLSLLVGKAPLIPVDGSARATYRGLYTDFTGPNLTLSTLAPPQATPLLPQDISGIRLDVRGIRTDFIAPNLTLTLPVTPPVVSSGAGRHGSREAARRKRELDVLRAKLEAFKDQRAEAEATLIATEDREVKARTTVLKRVRIKELAKPIEQYAPVARAIEKRNVALERHREILDNIRAHQLEARAIERKIEEVDEEAALYLMHWLMMEVEWRE